MLRMQSSPIIVITTWSPPTNQDNGDQMKTVRCDAHISTKSDQSLKSILLFFSLALLDILAPDNY